MTYDFFFKINSTTLHINGKINSINDLIMFDQGELMNIACLLNTYLYELKKKMNKKLSAIN